MGCAVQLACTYVAAKAVEFVPYKRLLQTMLTHVLGRAVPSDTATGMLQPLHAHDLASMHGYPKSRTLAGGLACA